MKYLLQKPERHARSVFFCIAFFFVVFGAKIAIIANYGSSMPFWDQWDAEADSLYRPWLEGTMRWESLFANHNEHRILTTRLLGLLLFHLNKGVWDPMLQMYANAVLHSAALVFLLLVLQKGLKEGAMPAFFFFASLLFAVPYGYENTLGGFQSQFYFLLMFSFMHLWAVIRFSSASQLWFPVIIISACLCFFSLASAALTIAAGVGTLAMRWLYGIQRTRATFLLIMLLTLACASAIYFTPVMPHHAALKAKSLFDLATAILRATGGGLLYIPVLLFMMRHFRNIRSASEHSWFVFALCLWETGQIFALAYGRSSGILSSRYLDLIAIGILLNSYCLLFMLHEEFMSKFLINSLLVWFVLVAAGIGLIVPKMINNIESKKTAFIRNEDNVRGYLATGDYTYLQKAPYYEIPYPDAARLKSLLDNKTIRYILTPVVNGNNVRDGLGFYREKSRMEFFAIGSILVLTGMGLLMVELTKTKPFGLAQGGDSTAIQPPSRKSACLSSRPSTTPPRSPIPDVRSGATTTSLRTAPGWLLDT